MDFPSVKQPELDRLVEAVGGLGVADAGFPMGFSLAVVDPRALAVVGGGDGGLSGGQIFDRSRPGQGEAGFDIDEVADFVAFGDAGAAQRSFDPDDVLYLHHPEGEIGDERDGAGALRVGEGQGLGGEVVDHAFALGGERGEAGGAEVNVKHARTVGDLAGLGGGGATFDTGLSGVVQAPSFRGCPGGEGKQEGEYREAKAMGHGAAFVRGGLSESLDRR